MPKKGKKYILWSFLALLGITGIFSLRKVFLPAVDYTLLSEKIEQTLDRYFSEKGIEKEDILLFTRQEKEVKGKIIPEIAKEIKIPAKASLSEYRDNLQQRLKNTGAKVYRAEIREDRLYFEIGYRKNRLFNLILVPKTPVRIALVIDDLGYNRKQLDAFLQLNIPLTFAILPGEAFSRSLAEELTAEKKEIILHLPLEPKNRKENPGRHALWTKMSSKEIADIFDRNLSTVPGVIGVNNHMGSGFTENEEKMYVLLNEIKRKNLYFFDSYTSKKSKGKEIAEKINLSYLQNQVFVDVKTDSPSIEKKIEELLALAKNRNYAIGLGHIHSKHTPEVLSALLPRLQKEEVEFVTLSEILKQK